MSLQAEVERLEAMVRQADRILVQVKDLRLHVQRLQQSLQGARADSVEAWLLRSRLDRARRALEE